MKTTARVVGAVIPEPTHNPREIRPVAPTRMVSAGIMMPGMNAGANAGRWSGRAAQAASTGAPLPDLLTAGMAALGGTASW